MLALAPEDDSICPVCDHGLHFHWVYKHDDADQGSVTHIKRGSNTSNGCIEDINGKDPGLNVDLNDVISAHLSNYVCGCTYGYDWLSNSNFDTEIIICYTPPTRNDEIACPLQTNSNT